MERRPQKDTSPSFERANSTLDFPPITSSEVHVQLSMALSTLKLHTISSRSVKFEVAFVDKLAAKNGLKMLLAAAMLFKSRQTQEYQRYYLRKRSVRRLNWILFTTNGVHEKMLKCFTCFFKLLAVHALGVKLE